MLHPLFLAIIRDCVSTVRVSRLFLHPLSLYQLKIYSNLATVKQNSVYCSCMPSNSQKEGRAEKQCTLRNKLGLAIHADELQQLHNNFSMPSDTLTFIKYFNVDYGAFTESDENYLIK